MKTATTKLLKKEIMIIELPRLSNYTLTSRGLFVEDLETKKNHVFKGSYTLLGKPDEIKEEDAEKLFYNPIDSTNLTHYANLRNLFSLLESEIYWENPYKKPDNYNLWAKYGDFTQYGVGLTTESLKWNKAQEKTFNRNRTLIFVKN